MSIVFCKTKGSREEQIIEALSMLGQNVICLEEELEDINYDINYMNKCIDFCQKQKTDMVWSVDFFPILARACHYIHIPYISWVTEKNIYTLYSNTIEFQENFIFIAEEYLYYQMKDRNLGHIFYMMPGGVIKLDKIEENIVLHLPQEGQCKYLIAKDCSDYLRGYLRGIVEVQLRIYGYHFVEKLLNDTIKEEFYKNISRKGLGKDYKEEPLEYLIDNFLCDTITIEEKERVKNKISIDKVVEENTDIIGKININITDRKWKKGMSFEMLAIMGAGGFLITNYQEGLEEYFEIGTELIIFENYEDLEKKIAYYQTHEEERKEIAKRGQKAVLERYLLVERIKDIFYILGKL